MAPCLVEMAPGSGGLRKILVISHLGRNSDAIHSGSVQVFLIFLYGKQSILKLLIECLLLNTVISFGVVMTQYILRERLS